MRNLSLIGLAFAGLAVTTPVLASGGPWSGWHAGINIGGQTNNTDFVLLGQGEWQDVFLPPSDQDPAYLVNPFGNGPASSTGVIGGGQIGADIQTGGMVWGFESDLSALSGTATRNFSGVFPSLYPSTIDEHTSVDWLATVRGRVGTLITNNTLLYVTGGLAFGQVSGNSTLHYYLQDGTTNRDISRGSGSMVVPGWTIGVGGETQLGGGWSLKGEYLYVDLAAADYNTFYEGSFAPFFSENISAPSHINILRVGLNYHFNQGAMDSSGGADLSFPSPPAMVAPRTWAGAYAGVNLGGAFGTATATDTDVGDGFYNAPGDTFSARTTGPVGGVQVGYNWQAGSAVLGVEGDVGYLGFRGTASSSLDSSTVVTAVGGLAGAVRARVGVTNGKFLGFLSGGVIMADVHATANDPYIPMSNLDPSPAAVLTSHTGFQTGWTAGAGVEMALAEDWSIKAEYQYFDLGSKLVSGLQMNPDVGTPAFGWTIHNTGSIVKVGLNKKF
ncbi:MAG: outer membrane beta-barrel protein [Bauldia sp.]